MAKEEKKDKKDKDRPAGLKGWCRKHSCPASACKDYH